MSSAPNETESEPPSAPAPVAAEEAHVGRSASPEAINSAAAITSPVSPATSTKSLKRTADMMDDDEERQESKRKRISDGNEDGGPEPSTSKTTTTAPDGTDANRLVKEIGDELLCGCCSALCYNPVLVLPCQHYYCGSCYTLWTRVAGVNCPSCRSPVSSIIPSRAIQSLIDTYLRCVPSRARVAREKEQADEIYAAGQSIPVPAARARSPDIVAPMDNDAYYRPCPHCPSTNDFNWACPEPIIDPSVDPARARLLTDGIPPGHAKCGNCEHLHAARAPTTSRCDFCFLTFCGLVSPTRCHAKRINEARPGGVETLPDILVNTDVYNAFGINAVEFDYMLDYLREHDINPRFIYAEIAESLISQEDGWRPLLDRGLFPAVTERAAAEASQPPPINPPSTLAVERPVSPPMQDTDTPITEATPAAAAATAEPHDHEMIDAEAASPNLADVPPPAPAPLVDGSVPNGDPVASSPTVVASVDMAPSNSDEMVIDSANVVENPAVIEPRPPTPLVVPERLPTPPPLLSEPTLDVLPVEVEPGQSAITPPVPLAVPATIPPTPSDPQVVIVASEDEVSNHSSDEGSSHSQEDEPSEEPASSPPVPTTEPSRGPQLHKICRTCAVQVLIWGARSWWIKERAKAVESGELAENVRNRKDCDNMGNCEQEFDNSHAREFNHIPKPLIPPATGTTVASNNTEETLPVEATPPPPTESEGSSQTTVNESRSERPEQPSRPVSPGRERMDVDPPAQDPAPIMTTLEAPVSTDATVTVDHVMAIPTSLSELIASTSVSQPSGSNIDPPTEPIRAPSAPAQDFSEKIDPTHLGDGDIRPAVPEESEAPNPIPIPVAVAPTGTR